MDLELTAAVSYLGTRGVLPDSSLPGTMKGVDTRHWSNSLGTLRVLDLGLEWLWVVGLVYSEGKRGSLAHSSLSHGLPVLQFCD